MKSEPKDAGLSVFAAVPQRITVGRARSRPKALWFVLGAGLLALAAAAAAMFLRPSLSPKGARAEQRRECLEIAASEEGRRARAKLVRECLVDGREDERRRARNARTGKLGAAFETEQKE